MILTQAPAIQTSPDVLKIVAVVAGFLIASPFMMASFRAFFFFGQMTRAAQSTEKTVARVEQVVTDFTATTIAALADHESRLITIEAERREERRQETLRFGRRATDSVVVQSDLTEI